MDASRSWLCAALVLLSTAAGCLRPASATGDSGGPGGAGGPGTPAPGGSSATDGGVSSPPPALPPEPNGFQLTVAPLLDAQGCTECHHAGRPIDLTHYPFMAGAPDAAAQKLLDSFQKGMPPAPRDPAPASVVDQVTKWRAAGMKP